MQVTSSHSQPSYPEPSHSQPHSKPRRRFHRWLWLGLPAGTITATTLGLLIAIGTGPAGGVRVTSNLEPYAVAYLHNHDLITSDETVIAYYDATITLNGREAAILTNRRLIYHRPSHTTSLPLDQIAYIHHDTDHWIGDIIQVVAHSGEIMVIEIAPLNDGPRFLAALENQVARVKAQSYTAPAPNAAQFTP
ncbi:hypothetical protein GFS31_42610 (plasmid) [Leptolyngbya sp. BL0902]|uniref:PH domain-containing protein n=1 Tax=Leptolyngbya sp. BL0902 TaxID=1115757 RepID=UPI0018E83467|nr:PH domain-containing protein [Leptolyngbya sp. BL0902]QQE67548.1 hypothetical protein GFS31_42610 [Leptolyngbya sp. BL0902]